MLRACVSFYSRHSRCGRGLLLGAAILSSPPAFVLAAECPAPGFVEEIVSATTLRARLKSTQAPGATGPYFAISDQDTGRVLGVAFLQSALEPSVLLLNVEVHEREALIRQGDCVLPVDHTTRNDLIPPRFDLMHRNVRGLSARYEPFAYEGVWFRHTAAPLSQGDWIVGPSIVGYGWTPNLTVSTSPLLNFVGRPNLTFKHAVFENADLRLAGIGSIEYDAYAPRFQGSFGILSDIISNSRFISYYKLIIQSPHEKVAFLSSADDRWSPKLLTSVAFLFGDWNRLILGPQFDFSKGSLGGILAVAYVYDSFTWMLGVASEDFSRPNTKEGTLSFGLDFWWRW
ncbi:MAG: hypothetical protein AB7P04_13635 [Bacteriovoracia bacterium]